MSTYGEGTEGLPEEVLKAAELSEGDEVQFWQTVDKVDDIDTIYARNACFCCLFPLWIPPVIVCQFCLVSSSHAQAQQEKNKFWLVTTEDFIQVTLDSPRCTFPTFNCCCISCITGTFIVGPALGSTGTHKQNVKLEMIVLSDDYNMMEHECFKACLPEMNSMRVQTAHGRVFSMRGADNDFGFPDRLMKASQARMLQLQSMGAQGMASLNMRMMTMGMQGMPSMPGAGMPGMNQQQQTNTTRAGAHVGASGGHGGLRLGPMMQPGMQQQMMQQQMMQQQMMQQQMMMQQQQPQMAMMGGQPVLPVMSAVATVVPPGGGAPAAQEMVH